MAVTAGGILAEGVGILTERGKTYDKPSGERSMEKTVAVFNLHHGLNLTEAQGWHFMQILKDVRLFTKDGYHHDSALDGTNYSALKGEARHREFAEKAPVEPLKHVFYDLQGNPLDSDPHPHIGILGVGDAIPCTVAEAGGAA